MQQDEGAARLRIQAAVKDVVEAAMQWAAVDYGNARQLEADAALADAVRQYQLLCAAVRLSVRPPVIAPDRVDV